MEPGLLFDRVWKKFRRGEIHDSLRDLIPAAARRLTRGRAPSDALAAREFWAVRDVSFEVKPGEALGIIGANGAGKSTVLKMLNRIVRPTRGYVEVRGRAGALIEVSAGFHQDLTGRENVFLQGSIMGMSKAEMLRKFDQIVAFSGIAEDAIDTPVKRYSSGMNARLGFSIAAHLDPDVLIIDEVLSVGDFAFQDRAFGRIKEMVRSGIPVVLVSHQLDRIAALCTKAILLSKGQVVAAGSPTDCIAQYVQSATAINEGQPMGPVRIDAVSLSDDRVVRPGAEVTLRARGEVLAPLGPTWDPLVVRVRAVHWYDEIRYEIGSRALGVALPEVGAFEAEIDLQLNLGPGVYRIDVVAADTEIQETQHGGASVYVRVAEGSPPFAGAVQLNAQMRVLRGAAAAAGPAALAGRAE